MKLEMKIIEHERIKGLKIIDTDTVKDFRGEYNKKYEKNIYEDSGIYDVFTETSEILSSKGVLRGLHFQTRYSQAKLVHVIKGKVYDVAVDLRPDSETFGEWAGFYLEEGDNKAVMIPENFAHGFLVLEDNTIFTYQCSGTYDPPSCGGIQWDDASLNISWPLEKIESLKISEKDMHKNMSLLEYKAKFGKKN